MRLLAYFQLNTNSSTLSIPTTKDTQKKCFGFIFGRYFYYCNDVDVYIIYHVLVKVFMFIQHNVVINGQVAFSLLNFNLWFPQNNALFMLLLIFIHSDYFLSLSFSPLLLCVGNTMSRTVISISTDHTLNWHDIHSLGASIISDWRKWMCLYVKHEMKMHRLHKNRMRFD